MFGKKSETKEKGPSQKDILTSRIVGEVEQLTPGQTLTYKLPEFYWPGLGGFLMVELNPSYPDKGRKYILSSDKIDDGQPAGKKSPARESNNPKDFAEWVFQFNGERFG
jgi:hypothetical protein